MKPYSSIVLCTFNGAERKLGPCLESLLGLDYPAERFEVIVIDDGSADNTPRTIERYSQAFAHRRISFTPIKNKANKGLYASKQEALEASSNKSEVIAVTDDDCTVEQAWLSNHTKHYNNQAVGSVGGLILSASNNSPLERFAADPRNRILSNTPSSGFIHGANCSYQMDALKRIGGFNPATISGGDAEVSFRLLNSGYDLVYEPGAIVHHHHRTSLGGLWKQFAKYGSGDYALMKEFGTARYTPRRIVGEALTSLFELAASPLLFATLIREDTETCFKYPFFNLAKCLGWINGYNKARRSHE